MATQSEMTQGYPTPAEILTYLADLGVEIPTENYAPWHDELKQFVWTIANAARWAMTLSVYPASSTTFNVRGGQYRWRGTVKTYTPGTAIDPADNDTTYVWMNPDNTIGSGVDGDGWPTTDYLPLAEIDVDSDGVITAVRDKRGGELLAYGDGLVRLGSESVDLNAVAFTALATVPTGKVAIPVMAIIRDLSASAGNTVLTLGQSTDKDDFLGAQTLSNLNAAGKAAVLQPVPNATPAAVVEYAAGTQIGADVTTAAGSACTCTIDLFGHLVDA